MTQSRLISAFGPATIQALPRWLRTYLAIREMGNRSVHALNERAHYLQYAFGAVATSATAAQKDGPIWQYWDTGYDDAPLIIQRCIDSVRRQTGDRQYTLLSNETMGDFVRLPKWVMDKREVMGTTHFSDILRVNLLKKYGGTWIDASVFLSGKITNLTSLPFFAFSRPNDPYLLSSWFMHSTQEHVIPSTLAEMLSSYWKSENTLKDYFAIHYMFEAATTLNGKFRSAWLDTPVRWAEPPHWIQLNFSREPSSDELMAALSDTPVHKLSYKFDETGRAALADCIDRIMGLCPSASSTGDNHL